MTATPRTIALVAVRVGAGSGRDSALALVRGAGAAPEIEDGLLVAELPPAIDGADKGLELGTSLRQALVVLDPTVAITCGAWIETDSVDPPTIERMRVARAAKEAAPGELIVTGQLRRRLMLGGPFVFEPVETALDARFRVTVSNASRSVTEVGRRVIAIDPAKPELDPAWFEGGFASAALAARSVDLSELVFDTEPTAARRPFVVIGEPAVGKTFAARRLRAALESAGADVCFTDFEAAGPRVPDARSWAGSSPRFWIVNAADEEWRRSQDMSFLRRDAAAMAEVTTIVFMRPDSSFAEVTRGWSSARVARILPLSQDEAKRELDLVDDDGTWQRLLVTTSALVGSEGSPASAWTYLELSALRDALRHAKTPPPDLRGLRRLVLERRCAHRRGASFEGGRVPSVDEILSVAGKLAAVTLASGAQTYDEGDGSCSFSLPDVLAGSERQIACWLPRTGLVERAGSGYRFAANHLEEDLAAVGLSGLVERHEVAALRNLLHDGIELRPALSRVARLLEEHHGAKRLGDATRADPSIQQTLLERALESLDASDVPPLWAPADFSRALADMEAAVVAHMSSALTDRRAYFLLSLAFDHGWWRCASAAVAITADAHRPSGVRSLAAYVATLHRPSALPSDVDPRLLALVHEIGDTTDDDLSVLRAHLVHQRLMLGAISPRDAMVLATPPERRVSDARGALLDAIAERLDLDAARVLVDGVRGLESGISIRPAIQSVLVGPAARVVIAHGTDPDDTDRIEHCVRHPESYPSLHDALDARLARSPDLRRELVLRLRRDRRWVVTLDTTEDTAWLLDLVERDASFVELFDTDLWLAAESLERNSDPRASVLRDLLRAHGKLDALDAQLGGARRVQEDLLEFEGSRSRWAQQRRGALRPLEDAIELALQDPRGPTARLHILADLLWGPRLGAMLFVGSWEELSDVTRKRVLRGTIEALREATPARVPRERTMTGAQVNEGIAFRQTVLWASDDWLSETDVTRWLPLALATVGSLDDGLETVLDHCHRCAPRQTRQTILDEMKRWANEGFVPLLGRLPARLREDSELVDGLIRFVHTHLETARPSAILVFDALLSWGAAARGRTAALIGELTTSEDLPLRHTAIGFWFAHQPSQALTSVMNECVDESSVRAVFGAALSAGGTSRAWGFANSLDAAVLAKIAPLLARLVPRSDDDSPDGLVTPHHRLAALRDGAVARVLREHLRSPTLGAARVQIATLPAYADWAARTMARMDLAQLVADARHPAPSPEDAAAAIRGEFAIANDAGDLALWIVQALRQERDRTDMLLLVHKDANGQPQHVGERVLQAFLRKELAAWLEARRLSAHVVREPEEQGGDKPDFVVQVGSMVVPIEVKWSDNTTLEGHLKSQLVDRYLRTSERSHGVYFVASVDTPERQKQQQHDLTQKAEELSRELRKTVHVVVADFRPHALVRSHTEHGPAKKRPAKKRPAKKRPAKKRLAKKRPAKKRPAKKRPAKKRPAKKKIAP